MVAFDTPRAVSVAVLLGCILHQAYRTTAANEKLQASWEEDVYSALVLRF